MDVRLLTIGINQWYRLGKVPSGNAVKLSPKGLNLNNLRCKPEDESTRNSRALQGFNPFRAVFLSIFFPWVFTHGYSNYILSGYLNLNLTALPLGTKYL